MKNPLRKFRESRQLSRADAQVVLGVDYSVLCRVEGGYQKPSAKLVDRLAELGVDRDKFLAAWERYVAAERRRIETRIINGDRARV